MKRVSVPGKVMLAGEYAVLLPGEPSLVAGVERRLFVDAQPSARWEATSAEANWHEGEAAPASLSFVAASVAAMRERYALSPLHLRTVDELHAGGSKLGLGGSAAVTVATVWALAPAHATDAELWAIADEVHRSQQGGQGSGVDIAACVHGGVVRYTREPLEAARVDVHPDVRLLLVWTGTSARTAPRLTRWSALVHEQPVAIRAFAKLSREAVQALEDGLRRADRDLIRGAISQSRAAFRGLEEISGLELETEPLRRAADVAWQAGAAGKLSGAGGGDCAIVIALGDAEAARVTGALSAASLTVIPVGLAARGVVANAFF